MIAEVRSYTTCCSCVDEGCFEGKDIICEPFCQKNLENEGISLGNIYSGVVCIFLLMWMDRNTSSSFCSLLFLLLLHLVKSAALIFRKIVQQGKERGRVKRGRFAAVKLRYSLRSGRTELLVIS